MHSVLENYKGKVKYQLTPMSTLIEGELSTLFEIIEVLHEIPFKSGVNRVTTNIRIDDRRDKKITMNSKVQSVEEKLETDFLKK